jgi:hypothetical protein
MIREATASESDTAAIYRKAGMKKSLQTWHDALAAY